MEQTAVPAVERAIETMRERLAEPITVEDLARSAMFSKFHFCRVFREVTGVTPGRFLSALRIEEAKNLLSSTSLTVADISQLVGYSSVGTFSSTFRNTVGLPPTGYRIAAKVTASATTVRTRDIGEPHSPVSIRPYLR